MTIQEFETALAEFMPTAAMDFDNEGQIIIYTGFASDDDGQIVEFDAE